MNGEVHGISAGLDFSRALKMTEVNLFNHIVGNALCKIVTRLPQPLNREFWAVLFDFWLAVRSIEGGASLGSLLAFDLALDSATDYTLLCWSMHDIISRYTFLDVWLALELILSSRRTQETVQVALSANTKQIVSLWHQGHAQNAVNILTLFL